MGRHIINLGQVDFSGSRENTFSVLLFPLSLNAVFLGVCRFKRCANKCPYRDESAYLFIDPINEKRTKLLFYSPDFAQLGLLLLLKQ